MDPPDRLIDSRHLECLRHLLRTDYLTAVDWERALLDTARGALEALGAGAACIALHHREGSGDEGEWVVYHSNGEVLRGDEVSVAVSRSVLDEVAGRASRS